MSEKDNDKEKDNLVILNEKEFNTKTKEDNPFKHFKAIPTGPLHTKTKEVNPFLVGSGNQDKPLPKPKPDKTKKPVSKE